MEHGTMNGYYLYGVIGAGPIPAFETEGLAGGVHVIFDGDVGAIAGAAPENGFQCLQQEQAVRLLLKHQRVLEEATAQTTILPVKFGTVAPDKGAVRRMLTQGAGLLSSRLAELAGCVQMEIVAQWQLDQVFAEIAREAEIAELRRAAETSGTADAGVRLGQAVKNALERRRAALSNKICTALGTIATAIATNPLMDDRMAVNAALLLNRLNAGLLEGVLKRLDTEMAGTLTFRSIGPLPPASFATVEVSFPSPGVTERACKLLGLSPMAGSSDIISAFQRLERLHNPVTDGAPVPDPGALLELTEAYRYLMSLASPAGERGGAAGLSAGDGDVIINVVRKEMTPPAPVAQELAA
jgi:hypothetical protein